MSQIVTRFAPSPTGLLHAGNYRTAVYAYLFARKNKGKFILRIEDTDRARSKQEYEDNIREALSWLTLENDATYRQSENAPHHETLLRELVESGKAYVSKEEPKEPGGRTEVVRFKNPNRIVTFTDAIRGDISVDTTDLGDFIIARSFTEPVFHFAVVADDAEEGVTHIIRGEDHISNTPRQILIREALGFAAPTYAHLPLVLGSDRTKLSKRKGAKAITEYRDLGFLPGAVLNYLALVGWNEGTDKEIYDKDELVSVFSLEKIQKSPGIFDETKLRWINKQHLRLLPESVIDAEIVARGANYPKTLEIFKKGAARSDLLERIETFGDIDAMLSSGEFDFYERAPVPVASSLLWKKDPSVENTKAHITSVIETWETIPHESFTSESVKLAIWDYAEAKGRGAVLWPVRYALSGRDRSPDPFTLAEALGKEETLKRLAAAITILSAA